MHTSYVCRNTNMWPCMTANPIIRRTNHTILLTKNKKKKWCASCMLFRDTLRSQLSRLKQMEVQTDRLTTPHSHTAYKYLDREELSSRLSKDA